MQFFSILALAGSAAAATAATHSPNPATDFSSGTVGVLSKFDDELFTMSRMQVMAVGAARVADDGSFTTCLPVYGGANATDCNTVIDNIAANTNDIGVAPGFCLNWWSGTCAARVCARGDDFVTLTDPYYEKASVIAGRLRGDPLKFCIPAQESAVVSDCQDYAGDCGVYRYFLQVRR